MTLAARLSIAIAGRPKDQVARLAGINRKTLRRILAGRSKRGAYADTLDALARTLGVRPEWLAFERGEMVEGTDARA